MWAIMPIDPSALRSQRRHHGASSLSIDACVDFDLRVARARNVKASQRLGELKASAIDVDVDHQTLSDALVAALSVDVAMLIASQRTNGVAIMSRAMRERMPGVRSGWRSASYPVAGGAARSVWDRPLRTLCHEHSAWPEAKPLHDLYGRSPFVDRANRVALKLFAAWVGETPMYLG